MLASRLSIPHFLPSVPLVLGLLPSVALPCGSLQTQPLPGESLFVPAMRPEHFYIMPIHCVLFGFAPLVVLNVFLMYSSSTQVLYFSYISLFVVLSFSLSISLSPHTDAVLWLDWPRELVGEPGDQEQHRFLILVFLP